MATEVNIVELEIQLQENFTKKLENIEKALDPVQKKLDSMKNNIIDLTNGLRDMISAFKLLSGNTSNFKKRVTQLNTEMKGLKKSSTDMSASIKKSTTVGISQFNKLQTEVKSLKNETNSTNASMSSFSKTMRNLKIGASLYAGFRIGNSLLTQASDAQEASNLFNVIFDDLDESMKTQSENFRNKYGLSTSTYAQQIAELGATYKNMGLSATESFSAAQKAMVDALDISSGFNKSIEESILKVKSGISGETEPLKRLGIIVTVDAMNAYAASIGKSYTNMNQLERALLRTQKITEDLQKSNISGDFLRTSKNYAVSLSRVKELWVSIKEELGTGILPVLTDVLSTILENKEALIETGQSLGNVLGVITKFFAENSQYIKTLLTLFVTAKAVGGIKFAVTMSKGVMAAVKTLGALMGVSTAVVGGGLILTVGTAAVIDQGVQASKKEQQDVLEGMGNDEITNMYLQSWKDERNEMIKVMNEEGLTIQTMSEDAVKHYNELAKKIEMVENNTKKGIKTTPNYVLAARDEAEGLKNTGTNASYIAKALSQMSEITNVKGLETGDTINNLLKPLIETMDKDLLILTKSGADEIEKYKSEIKNQKKILEKAIDEDLKDDEEIASNRIKYLTSQIEIAKKEDKIEKDYLANIEKYKESVKAFANSLKSVDIKADMFDTEAELKLKDKIEMILTNVTDGMIPDEVGNLESQYDTLKKTEILRSKMEKVKARIGTILENKDQELTKKELASLEIEYSDLKNKVRLEDKKQTILDQRTTLRDNLSDIETLSFEFGVTDTQSNRSKADAYREYLVGLAQNGITELERYGFDEGSREYANILAKVVEEAIGKANIDIDKIVSKDFKKLNLTDLNTSLTDIESVISAIEGSTGDISLLPEDIQQQLEKAREVKEEVEDLIKPKKELLKSSEKFKSTMDSIAGVFNQLADITGSETLGNVGGLVSSLGGLSNIKFGDMGLSSMSGVSAIANGAGAALAVAGAIGSFVDSESAKEEERGAEEAQKYEDNTNALIALTETMKQNTENIKTLANNLIEATSLLPTLGNISSGESIFSGIFEGIEESEKDLGELSTRAKYKKKGGWFSSSSTTYRTNEYSTEQILGMLGFDTDTANLTFQGLKDFRESLDYFTNDVLKDMSKGKTPESMIGDFLESAIGKFATGFLGSTMFGGSYHYKGFTSNIEEYKANVEAMIETMQQLKDEEAEFFRGATMESFEGIGYVDAKELREDYEDLFDELGLDTDVYSDLIDEMVSQNQVLVTSMQDVRSSFVSAFAEGGVEIGSAFIESMSSYFSKLKTNISQIIYDTVFSDVTDMGDKFFTDFAEGLLSAKKGEKTIQEAISDTLSINDDFFSELYDMSKVSGTMDDYWNEMRQALVDSGLSKEVIDQILPPSDAVTEWASNLVTAMNSAIDDSTFDSFSTSLGESLYDTVKDSLIQAFADSTAYQNLIGNFMEDVDFTGLSFEESFNLIESKMDEFNDELKSQGLEFQAETGATDTVDVIATSSQVAQDTTGATITNNYKYYVIDIDGSYVGVDSIEKMKENFEADGFIREENTKF